MSRPLPSPPARRWQALSRQDRIKAILSPGVTASPSTRSGPQRLQVLLDEAEFADIRRAARRQRMTVAEWVRQALRRARQAEPSGSPRTKLSVVREAARGAYPTADLPRMLEEIEQGYGGG